MTLKSVTSFEVLARPIAPGVPNVAYVQQGFFIQITNIGAAAAPVDILFQDTPAFVASKGAIKLFCNYIDNTGAINQYPVASFLTAPVGFGPITIPAGATFLFGVQYLLLPPPPVITTPGTGSTPQDQLEARGIVSLSAPAGTNLIALVTTRQVFNNYSPTGALLDISEGAYVNPLIGGPQIAL